MLADQYAAILDEGQRDFTLDSLVCPGAGVLDFHGDVGADGADAQIEGGEAGNDFRVGVSADIADLGLDISTVDFRQLHAGDDAGDIAGLEDVGEVVLHVGQTGGSGLITGCVAESHGRIGSGGFDHIVFMAEGIGEDDLAALGYEPLGRVEAFLIFRDAVFVDDLLVGKAESSLHGFHAVDVGKVVTDVFIVQQDNAYFEIFFGNTFSRGCGECAKSKYQNKNDADKLLHEWDPPVKIYRVCFFRMVL